ncbi:MAG: radical SAM protein [Oligoflexia bacterium]|nr:radical SAM protein [Oligoflexia bacterium]
MLQGPTYLRVVVNARCSLACRYCHREGDPATARSGGLDTAELCALLDVALSHGIRKLKLLGGEPLLRPDLPQIVSHLRRADPDLDLSLITGGAVSLSRLNDCFDAGLSRANLSIHGYGLRAFTARTNRGPGAYALRQAVLHSLLDRGRFLKLNFVWRGPGDDADLGVLLDHAASWPVVVGVLDDLGDPSLGPDAIQAAVRRVHGDPVATHPEPDPHSLPTLRLCFADGLTVEVKDHHLGELAPWSSCVSCPARAACREGILALRLSHEGHLRPCMDRPDLGTDLIAALRAGGSSAASECWSRAVSRLWPAASRVCSEEAA